MEREYSKTKAERIGLKNADILVLIDLALMKNDREWFNELTDKLAAMPVCRG